ncbi:MAG: S-adenosylmethionine:tRNA ribosyltransferase-isomerase, partial [Caulobacteraceae bacterium]
MRLSDFDFDLPEDRIALRPVSPRDASRLLSVPAEGGFADRHVRDLPDLLREGDVLVLNNTKVIPARLNGVRTRDGSAVVVEATLHRRLSGHEWTAFMKPGKRLAPGDRVSFGETADRACLLGSLDATVKAKGDGGEVTLAFDLSDVALDEAIAER